MYRIYILKIEIKYFSELYNAAVFCIHSWKALSCSLIPPFSLSLARLENKRMRVHPGRKKRLILVVLIAYVLEMASISHTDDI